ncbi:putative E3 SUMO-protein ligase RNF212 [Neosynchiropus ocellatus]
MTNWICCNSCFVFPTNERRLAVTSCGHVVCSVCYQRSKPGECLICNTSCRISPLTSKSEKLEEILMTMKQEMQQMTKKLNEQSSYISKLEYSLQHPSAKTSSMSPMSFGCCTPRNSALRAGSLKTSLLTIETAREYLVDVVLGAHLDKGLALWVAFLSPMMAVAIIR